MRLISGIPQESKMEMKADLHDLIVSVLRKYPGLSYFQVSPVSQMGWKEADDRDTMISCLFSISLISHSQRGRLGQVEPRGSIHAMR
jgi:hypothetical protein